MGTALPDGTQELDRLFAQVERRKVFENATVPGGGVAAGAGSGGVPSQMSSTQADQLDFASVFSQPVMPGSGLQNGTFIEAPPEEDDGDSVIDGDENDLPYWEMVTVAGTWTVTYKADADGPDGHAIEFTQAAGDTSDEVYFEQTIPIDYYRRFVTTVRTKSDNADMGLKVEVDFLDTSGASVGSPLSTTYDNTSIETLRFWREPPALATQATVRFGCVNASGVDAATRTILFISVEEPTTYSVVIPFVYSYLSPAPSSSYVLSHPSDIIPGGVYRPDTQGFVLGIHAETNDTISAGSAPMIPFNTTQFTAPSNPSAFLSNGVTGGNGTQSLDGVSSYDFEVGDALVMILLTDGSFASTGGADYYGSIRLLLVVNDEGDW